MAHLRIIANDFNVSDNAIIARASHSDEFMLTPLSSATHIGDESKSRVPVNVLPEEQSEVPINFQPTIEKSSSPSPQYATPSGSNIPPA